MKLFDTAALDGVRKTADGYLVAMAKVARTGIQVYTGAEVGRPDMPTVRVWRPETEVFKADAMHSFAHRPLTDNHPPEMVTADNWKKYSIGQTGDEVVRDGNAIRVPMVVMDAAAIKAIENGKRELSMGYECTVEFRDGVTPEGECYDAVQSAIKANHLAIVTAARGGPELKIGDDQSKGDPAMADPIKTKTVLVDGLMVETTDAGAQAIAKLQKDLAAANAELEKANGSLAAKDAAHIKALEAKDGEIAALKSKVLDTKAIDAAIAARVKTIDDAKKIVPDLKHDGLSDAEIRRATVAKELGDAAVKDRSDEYIQAAFDTLLSSVGGTQKTDPVRAAFMQRPGFAHGKLATRDDADKAYAEMVEDIRNPNRTKAA